MRIDLSIRIFIYLLYLRHDLFLSCLGIDAYHLLFARILNAQIDGICRELVHATLLLVSCRCVFHILLKNLVAIPLGYDLLLFLVI